MVTECQPLFLDSEKCRTALDVFIMYFHNISIYILGHGPGFETMDLQCLDEFYIHGLMKVKTRDHRCP